MSSCTDKTGGNAFINRIYQISDSDTSQIPSLYNEWASTYNNDMSSSSQGYIAPRLAADKVLQHLNTTTNISTAKILDAGCGTGLVGTALALLGARDITGVDISPGMLDVARQTGHYGTLRVVDLTKALGDDDDGSYDVVVCVGTFTHAHVGPSALAEFVRVAKAGGVVVATIREDLWTNSGFEKTVDELRSASKVEIVSKDVEDYRRGTGVKARVVVLRVC